MVTKHQKAPLFKTVNQDGSPVTLEQFLSSKNVVLYFYPKDDTSGCTIEANEFTALVGEFDKLDTVILGVSKDGCESHQAFIEKFSLKVQLLADVSGELCDAYGVWQEKEKSGIKKMGIVRSTFVIDKNGDVLSAEYGVSAQGHAQKVLETVRSI